MIDRTAPVVQSIVRAGASPTNAASVAFTVTFTGLEELFNFDNMSAAGLAGLLGQLAGWLQNMGASQLDAIDIPFTNANLGDVLVKLGKLPEAIQCYQQAVQLEPDNQQFKAQLQALAGKTAN